MIIDNFFKKKFGLSSKAKLRKGLQVWCDLNKLLPEASGATENDKVRLSLFSKKVAILSKREKECLKFWLEGQVHDYKYNFCEFCTSSQEEFERRQLQIFESHLEVLQK